MSSKMSDMYNVPEGYFEGLKARLERIPAEHSAAPAKRPFTWMRIRPYVALAACLALLLTAGTILLDRKADLSGTSESIYEQMMYSDLIPDTDPDSIFGAPSSPGESYDISDEDIVDYLISSGASVELIALAEDQ
ncbi:MAG: hypothetical protein IJK96_06695 [Bacteroidales bacterium]|nr:hypothetical protein [Bacteroidales bacterium]